MHQEPPFGAALLWLGQQPEVARTDSLLDQPGAVVVALGRELVGLVRSPETRWLLVYMGGAICLLLGAFLSLPAALIAGMALATFFVFSWATK